MYNVHIWSGEYRLRVLNCNHMIDLIAKSRDSQPVFQKKTIPCNIFFAVKLGLIRFTEINKIAFLSISKHMILVLFLAQVDIQLSCFNYWSAVGIYEI